MSVHLVDQQRSLGLFVEALLGRPLHLRALEDPAAPAFTDGESLFLPASIDAHARIAARAAYRIAALHQVGSLQAGSFRFRLRRAARRLGRPDLLEAAQSRERRLPGLPRLSREAELDQYFSLHPTPGVLARLFSLVEALRIECWIARRYPGARRDQAGARACALEARPAVGHAALSVQLLESLLRHSLGDPAAAAGPARLGLGSWFAALTARLDAVGVEGADVHDSAGVAWWLADRLLEAGRVAAQAGEALAIDAGAAPGDEAPSIAEGDADDGASDGAPAPGAEGPGTDEIPTASEVPPHEAGPSGAAGPGGDLPADWLATQVPAPPHQGMLQPGRFHRRQLEGGAYGSTADGGAEGGEDGDQADADSGVEADGVAPEGTPIRRGRDRADPPRRARARQARRIGPGRSVLYDEWDWREQAYREAWCRVHEQTLAGADGSFIEEVRSRHRALIAQIRQQLRRVRPEARRRVATPGDGEELDWDRVLQSRLDRRVGVCSDDYLYTRHERAGREIAAAFLIDLSASTDFPIPEPGPPAPPAPPEDPERDLLRDDLPLPYLYGGYQTAEEELREAAGRPRPRRVIDVAREAMAITAEALAALGDRHAIYGFSSDGRDQVDFLIAKDFDEPVSAHTWAMLAAMQPRRATRMAAAIRHAVTRLRREPMRRRLLIVVSDGYPEDSDYGPLQRDDEYSLQDTAQALLEADQAGIATFCITIDPAGHDYLRRMCAPERYLVIDSVEALPAELVKIYRVLTTGRLRPADARAGATRAVRPDAG